MEEIVLKVAAGTDPAKFAGALAKNHNEGKRVTARAFGASANYAMSKGIYMAQQFFERNGFRLYTRIDTRKETLQEGDPIRTFTAEFFVVPADQDPLQA